MLRYFVACSICYFIAFQSAKCQEVDTIKKLTVVGLEDAEWSRDDSKLLYSSNLTGHWNIYLRDLKTGVSARLTDHEYDDETPVFSPDGKRILFSFTKKDDDYEVWIMNADGSSQKNLSNNPNTDFHPTWSPDGKTILFNSNRDDTSGVALFTMGPDGSNQKRITDANGFRTFAYWSPDGKYISFVKWVTLDNKGTRGRDICVMDADGKNEKNLTNNPSALNGWPSWSPDSKQITFSGKQDGVFQIWVVNKDGTGLKRLIKSQYNDRRGKFSRDGKRFAFDRQIPGVVTDIHIATLK